MNISNQQLKKIILFLWLVIIANLFLPTPGWLDQLLKVFGIFMLVAHTIECGLFFPKIKAHHNPAWKGFLLVLIFGVIHLKSLPNYSN